MAEIINLEEWVRKASENEGNTTSRGNYSYLLGHIGMGEKYLPLSDVLRIDGLLMILCTAGEEEVTVNFQKAKVTGKSIMVLTPNDMIELGGLAESNIEGEALFLPVEFLKLISLDSNTLNYKDIKLGKSTVLPLGEREMELMERYFGMLRQNVEVNSDDTVYTRNISRSLVSALIYQLLSIFRGDEEGKERETEESAQGGSRRQYYVRDFMNLLQQDFREHRSVGHYADRMYISAKYLSLIVKEATGRTATEWIDHFVILEAKNLLRYSGRNIQQIAYDLNFHNQSAFGKYFKHLTGMSPSDFRKS